LIGRLVVLAVVAVVEMRGLVEEKITDRRRMNMSMEVDNIEGTVE
jgi:hypothetical protein